MKALYEVERRSGGWAVFSPEGKKVAAFFTYREAKEKAEFLNKELKKLINNP